MPIPSAKPTRAAQRKQTQARILVEARRLFATLGYQRTTIRAIATAAQVNPALVMHYFTAKQQLFTAAAAHRPDELHATETVELADSLLASLRSRLDTEPTASLTLLRSMLTHDDAAKAYRQAAEHRTTQISALIDTPDARLRASLLTAIISGVITDRYLLRLTDLADAATDDIIAVLKPVVEELCQPPRSADRVPAEPQG